MPHLPMVDPSLVGKAQRFAALHGRGKLREHAEVVAILVNGGCGSGAIAKFLNANGLSVGRSAVHAFVKRMRDSGELAAADNGIAEPAPAPTAQTKITVPPPTGISTGATEASAKPFRTRPPIPGRDPNL